MEFPKEVFADPIPEIVKIAKAMISGDIHLVLGIRCLYFLVGLISSPKDFALFAAISAIEDDMEAFPIGKMRDGCSSDYLRRMDAEMDDYLLESKDEIFQVCREIISVFSGKIEP